jgi:hypothetical protein
MTTGVIGIMTSYLIAHNIVAQHGSFCGFWASSLTRTKSADISRVFWDPVREKAEVR